MNTKEYAILANEERLDPVPNDWSFKTSLDIQIRLHGASSLEQKQMFTNISELVKKTRFHQYRAGQSFNSGMQRTSTDQRLTWYKSCRDVYRQFLKGAKEGDSKEDFELPFFYIFNSTCLALFRHQNGK